ncbi:MULTISPECIES: WXG100 family type VII secretion target [Streptomyces]|uniref:WXG100 family type VII secretion target n=1 Tax=Streptomyces cacaoi TaxID=1898 RepID=A0A4Y3QW34_STRCI|nr:MULTISPECIES: WXG100 family type VII secretion target [Streptomyces]NNG83485.1 hypothetical protein [Streptomyces cacaoi]QHF95314.1 hypothetical protein DEH18_17210 [Streptomyces sp. NHF165]GEB49169.1 hypothetical protein SCA03_17200 [Streptomyces cacaoi]
MSVDFEARQGPMGEVQQMLIRQTEEIERQLSELQRQVRTVVDELAGDTIAAYDDAHHRWVQQVEGMRQMLHAGHTTLKDVGLNYEETDRSESARWLSTTAGSR